MPEYAFAGYCQAIWSLTWDTKWLGDSHCGAAVVGRQPLWRSSGWATATVAQQWLGDSHCGVAEAFTSSGYVTCFWATGVTQSLSKSVDTSHNTARCQVQTRFLWKVLEWRKSGCDVSSTCASQVTCVSVSGTLVARSNSGACDSGLRSTYISTSVHVYSYSSGSKLLLNSPFWLAYLPIMC